MGHEKICILMKKLFLSVICASVLSACSDNVFLKDASGVTVRVGQKMSDGPALVRLEVMGDRLIHVSSTPERKFADPESLIIIEPSTSLPLRRESSPIRKV